MITVIVPAPQIIDLTYGVISQTVEIITPGAPKIIEVESKTGLKGDKGDSGENVDMSITVVANENILQYDAVTGNGFKATSNNTAYRNKIVGVATADINNGFSGLVKCVGNITNTAWSWVAGDRIFLNGDALSTVAPTTGFIIQIGIAVSSDTVNLKIQTSILL